MGSGLILFVIVGAWLAVLVPMALRSHDTATHNRSADKFSHAMRVLSRRSARDVLVPRRRYSSLVVSETKSPRAARIPEERQAALHEAPVEPVVHTPRTPSERRARTLAVLIGLALIALGLTLAGIRPALYAQVACDLLVVAFVVHCRRQAVLRAQRARRRPRAARSSASQSVHTPLHRVAGIPDRMPARPAPLMAPLAAPAARYDDRPSAPVPAAATGTEGSSWSPVPVPPPTYVGKPMAPRREPRVLDLTNPGAWSAGLEGDDAGLEILEDGPELEEILGRRRAAGDW